MSIDNGVMTMRPLDKGLTIKPGKTVKLTPGGYHLMMFDLKGPLKQGDKVPVTLNSRRPARSRCRSRSRASAHRPRGRRCGRRSHGG